MQACRRRGVDGELQRSRPGDRRRHLRGTRRVQRDRQGARGQASALDAGRGCLPHPSHVERSRSAPQGPRGHDTSMPSTPWSWPTWTPGPTTIPTSGRSCCRRSCAARSAGARASTPSWAKACRPSSSSGPAACSQACCGAWLPTTDTIGVSVSTPDDLAHLVRSSLAALRCGPDRRALPDDRAARRLARRSDFSSRRGSERVSARRVRSRSVDPVLIEVGGLLGSRRHDRSAVRVLGHPRRRACAAGERVTRGQRHPTIGLRASDPRREDLMRGAQITGWGMALPDKWSPTPTSKHASTRATVDRRADGDQGAAPWRDDFGACDRIGTARP